MIEAFNDADRDDEFTVNEMKFIQNRFKTKLEFMPHMYTGYIMSSRDYYMGPHRYQSSLYIVNTFNFYQWRAIYLMKKNRLLVEDLSK